MIILSFIKITIIDSNKFMKKKICPFEGCLELKENNPKFLLNETKNS